LYARVSTRDRGQDVESQLAQLRAWASATGHMVTTEYVDEVSGSKGADQRPRLQAMLDAAHRREFDVVAFWAIDRLSREGTEAVLGYLRRLTDAGVDIHSHTETWLRTGDPQYRELLIGLMASLARIERARIADRTRSGLERVQAGLGRHGEWTSAKSGRTIRRLGRPGLDQAVLKSIAGLAGQGLTDYAIAKRLSVDPKSVKRYRPAALAEAAD